MTDQQPTETKGALNSATIRNGLYNLTVAAVEKISALVIVNQPQILAAITQILPPIAQPFAQVIVNAIIITISLVQSWFTKRVITARKAVGDIQGLYTKQK